METYKIPLVPGPVSVPEALRAVYQIDYGSADLEEEFFNLYAECEHGLQTGARHSESGDDPERRGHAGPVGSAQERHPTG